MLYASCVRSPWLADLSLRQVVDLSLQGRLSGESPVLWVVYVGFTFIDFHF